MFPQCWSVVTMVDNSFSSNEILNCLPSRELVFCD